MDMDVVGNKERLLKGILDGETTTDIEPASREERLLKAILENGGGGGSGSGFPTFELREVDNLLCAVQMGDVDYIGDTEHRQPFYITDGSIYALCIPIGKSTINSQIRGWCFAQHGLHGGDTTLFPVFFDSNNGVYEIHRQVSRSTFPVINPLEEDNVFQYRLPDTPEGLEGANNLLVPSLLSSDPYEQKWITPEDWWDEVKSDLDFSGIGEGIELQDLSSMASTINQIVSAMKALADASVGTTVTKYIQNSMSYVVSQMVKSWYQTITDDKKAPYMLLNDAVFTITSAYFIDPQTAYATATYKECDFTNDKLYDMAFTFASSKIYIQCTCHEATSLM